jgi:hypothetical protein
MAIVKLIASLLTADRRWQTTAVNGQQLAVGSRNGYHCFVQVVCNAKARFAKNAFPLDNHNHSCIEALR